MNSQVCHRSCPFSHFSSQHTTPCRHSYLCIQFQLLNWSGIKVICSIKDFFIKNPCSTKKMLFKIRTFSCIKLMFIYVYCFPYSFLPKSGWCSYAKISLYDPSTYRISLNNVLPWILSPLFPKIYRISLKNVLPWIMSPLEEYGMCLDRIS